MKGTRLKYICVRNVINMLDIHVYIWNASLQIQETCPLLWSVDSRLSCEYTYTVETHKCLPKEEKEDNQLV